MIESGSAAWMFMSIALVLLMTPGLAFFYGGLASSKDTVNTMKMSFTALGLIAVEWALVGYSFSFSPGNSFIGGFSYFGLNGVTEAVNADLADGIPHLAFMLFQMMFAIITPALISGAIIGRMPFKSYILFIIAWAIFVYNPICHWIWGPGGWAHHFSSLDFAGGTVVHISAGVSALVAAYILGPRTHDLGNAPHNVPFVLLGASLLWFGWFGFNGGSALAADGLASLALVNTNLAAAAAICAWVLIEIFSHGKTTAVGASVAAVIGLVAITPAAGFVSPLSAMTIGFVTAIICYFSLKSIGRSKVDDALDVFACHGVGGIAGALLTGAFASKSINPDGYDGLIYGGTDLMIGQLVTVLATILYSAIATTVIMKALKLTLGIRNEDGEASGMDDREHGEKAYHIG